MKTKRYEKILELITKYDIETQDELVSKLIEEGYNVTQATVSRDIRKLNLMKATNGLGRQKYVRLNPNEMTNDSELADKYVRVLKEGLIATQRASNLIVVKTVAGMAMAVAAALDALNITGIVGCIAGDDTIFCAIKNVDDIDTIIAQINSLIMFE